MLTQIHNTLNTNCTRDLNEYYLQKSVFSNLYMYTYLSTLRTQTEKYMYISIGNKRVLRAHLEKFLVWYSSCEYILVGHRYLQDLAADLISAEYLPYPLYK